MSKPHQALWSQYGSEVVGEESEHIFRFPSDGNLVLCHKAEILSLTTSHPDVGSPECKLMMAAISFEGYDRHGVTYIGANRDFYIDDIWFFNRKTLMYAAESINLTSSSWSHLQQEKAYNAFCKTNHLLTVSTLASSNISDPLSLSNVRLTEIPVNLTIA